MEDMPKTVLTIVVSLLLIAIGTFVVLVIVTNVGLESSITQTFTVDNPSVDKTVTLQAKPSGTPNVWQFNGLEWLQVNSAFLNWDGAKQLTILSGGMQG